MVGAPSLVNSPGDFLLWGLTGGEMISCSFGVVYGITINGSTLLLFGGRSPAPSLAFYFHKLLNVV